jgi:lysophospholipase L1-like esterase
MFPIRHPCTTHILYVWPFIILLLISCDSGAPLKPLSKNAVILAFGDSLTYGTGAAREQAYPAHLQALISRTIINAGIPGEVSLSGLKRLPGLLKRHRPELLILCHGGNDILRRYDLKQTRENLQQMIDIARENNTQILIIGVPQFGIFLSAAPFYKKLAETNQLPLENEVLSMVLKKSSLKSDQIHPNAAGYKVLAEHIQALLKSSGAI